MAAVHATSDFPEYKTIRFALDEDVNVATVTIDRPHALNAITQSMLDEFADLWARVRYDGRIHVVVLRANLESRAFSSGADIKGGDDGKDGFFRNPNVFSNRGAVDYLGPKMNFVWKPVVCAVHGMCAGAGLFWVNEADIAICSDDAQFFDPHLSRGIASAMGPIGMARRVNLGEVLRYTLLSNAERMTAETALRVGLVTEITTRDKLWERAHELAVIIAAYNPIAVQGTIKAIWESLELGRRVGLDRSALYSDTARTHSLEAAPAVGRTGDGKASPKLR